MRKFYNGLKSLNILSNLLLGILFYCFCGNSYKSFFHSIDSSLWFLANLYLCGLIINFIACYVVHPVINWFIMKYKKYGRKGDDPENLDSDDGLYSTFDNGILAGVTACLIGAAGGWILRLIRLFSKFLITDSLDTSMGIGMMTLEIVGSVIIYIFLKNHHT